MNMFQTMKYGADVAVAADPRELTQREHLDQVFADAVKRLGPPPVPAPLPPMGGGDFLDVPCSNPRARYQPSDHCFCGFHIGAHPRR